MGRFNTTISKPGSTRDVAHASLRVNGRYMYTGAKLISNILAFRSPHSGVHLTTMPNPELFLFSLPKWGDGEGTCLDNVYQLVRPVPNLPEGLATSFRVAARGDSGGTRGDCIADTWDRALDVR